MTGLDLALLTAYFAVTGALAVYGAHRYLMVFLYYRHRAAPPVPPSPCGGPFGPGKGPLAAPGAGPPIVTVQLPVYNERYVVERLLDRVCAIDWPRDRFEVQVLDDSTDDTSAIVARKAEEWRARGVDVKHVRRPGREGFKAGALASGLRTARGELLAIFDADFAPLPDVLRRTAPFFADPAVGLVQTRWEHLNRSFSLLTELEGIVLDGHLQIEQTARNRSGRFFNFNGTGGVWRRRAIEEAGGWQHDTLTEDLDISFRAQLAGWRFVYLPDVVSPAELPADMNAYKTQQHHWTKGAAQTARKLLGRVLAAAIPLHCKVEAALQLTMNSAYVLIVLLCLLMLPALRLRFQQGWVAWTLVDIPFFVAATSSVLAFYASSQREIFGDRWLARLRYLPLVISLGVGMSLVNAKAFLEGLFGEPGEFVRTPKHGIEGTRGSFADKRYRPRRSIPAGAELVLAAYVAMVAWVAARDGRWLMLPLLGLFLFGLLYVGVLSIAHGLPRPRPAP